MFPRPSCAGGNPGRETNHNLGENRTFWASVSLASRRLSFAHSANTIANASPLLGDDDEVVRPLGNISHRSLKVHPAVAGSVNEACRAVVSRRCDAHVSPDPRVQRNRNKCKLILQETQRG